MNGFEAQVRGVKLSALRKAAADLDLLGKGKTAGILGDIQDLQQDADHHKKIINDCMALMSGQAELYLPTDTYSVSAATLNAAAAGTLQQLVAVQLRHSTTKDVLFCANTSLLLTPAEVIVDADAGVPAVSPDPLVLTNGKGLLTVTPDTDAGATKVYASGDVYSVKIQVAADDKLLGFTVRDPVGGDLTVTFNVVA